MVGKAGQALGEFHARHTARPARGFLSKMWDFLELGAGQGSSRGWDMIPHSCPIPGMSSQDLEQSGIVEASGIPFQPNPSQDSGIP